ncbi:MAG: DinB family protein [Bryobacterales bacterium]|nr:DinB family protein [Bryobacterales bacterium]
MNGLTNDQALRQQLVELLDGGQAHLRFEDVVRDWPEPARGLKPPGAAHTPWQVLEHIRIALNDILEFSRNPHHVSPTWPEGYWPSEPAPANAEAWARSIAHIRLDLDAMKALVENPETDLFAPFAWGEGQALLREAMLAADHNAYHLGEMMTLRRALLAREGGAL